MQAEDAGRAFHLPDVLDPTVAAMLLAELNERRGHSLIVDGRAVCQVSTVCLQVLLAAAASWRGDGKDFAISNPSATFSGAVAILGMDGTQLPIMSKPE